MTSMRARTSLAITGAVFQIGLRVRRISEVWDAIDLDVPNLLAVVLHRGAVFFLVLLDPVFWVVKDKIVCMLLMSRNTSRRRLLRLTL
jgi:hypothetical protein